MPLSTFALYGAVNLKGYPNIPDAGQNNNSGTTPSQTFNKQPVSSQRTNAQVSAMGVLPQTNGVSTALSTTAGALLVLGSVMMLWSRRKNIKQ